MTGPPPIPLALVVCDAYHRDPVSRGGYLQGIFQSRKVAAFPAKLDLLTAYLVLTGYREKVDVRCRVEDLGGVDDPLAEFEYSLDVSDPRQTVEVIYEFEDATFPEAGEHAVQVLVDGFLLVERRIRVY